ncbi:universal stress protein [Halapricum desulfuricans]|nr:universal stress protein [Halapricum desulfuricans]
MPANSDGSPQMQMLEHEDVAWPSEDQRILVPFHEAVNVTETGLLGASIASGTNGTLYLLHAVKPGDTKNTDVIRHDAGTKFLIKQEFDVPVVQQQKELSDDLLRAFIESHDITSVLINREEESFFSRAGSDQTDGLQCHTIVGSGIAAFDSPTSILVPVAGGPHSGLAIRIAEAIATAYDCSIELLHVISEDASEQQENDAAKLLDTYSSRVAGSIEVHCDVLRKPGVADTIIEQSETRDLTVLGAPEKGELRRYVFGSTVDDIMNNTDPQPILTVHRKDTESLISRWF